MHGGMNAINPFYFVNRIVVCRDTQILIMGKWVLITLLLSSIVMYKKTNGKVFFGTCSGQVLQNIAKGTTDPRVEFILPK